MGRDTCDWCGKSTNRIQSSGNTWLCVSCCPDIEDGADVPDNAPPSWHHMNSEERSDWKSGLSMREIMEKHSWGVPP